MECKEDAGQCDPFIGETRLGEEPDEPRGQSRVGQHDADGDFEQIDLEVGNVGFRRNPFGDGLAHRGDDGLGMGSFHAGRLKGTGGVSVSKI